MLTIKTYLAPSATHGIGLYAAETIRPGKVVWEFNNMVDRVYSERMFLEMCLRSSEYCLSHFLNSTYLRSGKYFYLTDNARFINHSDDQFNIAFADDLVEVALREIKAGEEILENYYHSYDESDYFFRECSDPDPMHYIEAISLYGVENVDSTHLS